MQTFQNPILPGFYPDPSVCRVGDDYYLVTSTFAYFPGVPVFHSRDLVNWTQIGNVLERPSQLPLAGTRVSQGIFAPTIRYHDGTFYMITTNVSGGGNFVVTAKDPAGPWSDPYFLHAPGIDPSLFFDDDGKCYYHGTCGRADEKYYGDNEIYLQELDLATMKLVGERHVIWHCALKDAVWPEGPHIYKRGEYYYVLISEGGTGHEHAVTVARSKTLTGYYTGHKGNPILTHRHLGRNYPIVNVGHADLVETQNGEWWMVLLASRPYGGYYRNLGRETFLVPVTWEGDWPVINCGIGLVLDEERLPDIVPAPVVASVAAPRLALDFYKIDSAEAVASGLMYLRNPVADDYKYSPQGLSLRLSKNAITELDTVSFCCIRQRHMSFSAHTRMIFDPATENECAGLVIFQGHDFNYQFVLTRKGGVPTLQVVRCKKEELTVLAEAILAEVSAAIYLQISAQGQDLSFHYSTDGQNYTPIHENADARILSTDVAGGFVGNTIGVYASANGYDAGEKYATFTELVYEEVVC